MKVRPVVEGWREVNECFVAPDLSYERSRSWANLTCLLYTSDAADE